MTGIKIDLGSGVNKPAGYVGIDSHTRTDITADLRSGIPIVRDRIDEIRARDFFEHIADTLAIFNDCWRALRADGRLIIEVPRFPHVDAVKDPTHVSFFAVETFTEYLAGPDRLSCEYPMKLWDIAEMRHDDRRIWVTLTPRGK